MRIEELIDRLSDKPGELMRELVAKREEMIVQSEELQSSIANISKVIRIARDTDARRRRTEVEIEALRQALVGQGEVIDLTNLYLDNFE